MIIIILGDDFMKYFILGHANPDVDSIVSGILMEKLLKDDVDNV